MDFDVVEIGLDAESEIARQRPRRSGPGNHAHLRFIIEREAHNNCKEILAAKVLERKECLWDR